MNVDVGHIDSNKDEMMGDRDRLFSRLDLLMISALVGTEGYIGWLKGKFVFYGMDDNGLKDKDYMRFMVIKDIRLTDERPYRTYRITMESAQPNGLFIAFNEERTFRANDRYLMNFGVSPNAEDMFRLAYPERAHMEIKRFNQESLRRCYERYRESEDSIERCINGVMALK